MSAFRFSLEKALEWRRKQLELEETRFKQCVAALATLDGQRAELEAAAIRAELEVRGSSVIAGCDLEALGRFRRAVQDREAALELRRADSRTKMESQQTVMMAARRRCRLLERLRERRLAEWTAVRDKELEELAAESYLARWVKQAG